MSHYIPRVYLDAEARAHAVLEAHKRNDANVANGYQETWPHPKGSIYPDLWGTHGEKAVSLYSGIPWDGNFGNYAAADVGRLQVRATPYQDGHLIVQLRDKPGPYLGVSLSARRNLLDVSPALGVTEWNVARLMGWLPLNVAKRIGEWRADPKNRNKGAFWVPFSKLWPLDELLARRLRVV